MARNAASALRLRWADFRGYTPTERSLFYLSIEILWAGLATGMLSFNGPFVLKLGGDAGLISLMAALPALMAILFSIPAARFLESRRNRKRWIISSLAIGRSFFLIIALAPWLLPHEWLAPSIVVWVTLQAIPIALFNAGFLATIGDVCPPDLRPRLFATRNIILAGSVAVSAFVSGLWLERMPFPLNYQILNLLAFVLAQISTYIVSRIDFPVHDVAALPPPTRAATARRFAVDWSALKQAFAERRAFINMNVATLIGWIGVWAAGPLYTIYLVNTLQFNEGWLGTNSTLGQIGVIIGATLWTRFVTRRGKYWVLMRALLLCWLYPIAIVLVPWATPILLLGFLNALNEVGISITHFSIMLDLCPPERRSSYLAMHTTLMNVGAMIAPLAAAPLAGAVGVQVALVICGLIRLIGVGLFRILPIQSPAPDVPAKTAN